jgi:hypothetical protein
LLGAWGEAQPCGGEGVMKQKCSPCGFWEEEEEEEERERERERERESKGDGEN